MDQPGKVANPARGQLNRENNIPLSPRACLRMWSRETGSAVPPRISLLISILRLNLVYRQTKTKVKIVVTIHIAPPPSPLSLPPFPFPFGSVRFCSVRSSVVECPWERAKGKSRQAGMHACSLALFASHKPLVVSVSLVRYDFRRCAFPVQLPLYEKLYLMLYV